MERKTLGFPRSQDKYLLALLQVQLFLFFLFKKRENKLEIPLHRATFT